MTVDQPIHYVLADPANDAGPVSIPAGAISADDWDDGGRLFYGSTDTTIEAAGWLRDAVRIYTGGTQGADGAYGWEIVAGPVHPDAPLNAAQARSIGEALIAAADELDQTSGTPVTLLASAAQHAHEAAYRVADAQLVAGGKLDDDAVKHVVVLLLAAEKELARLGEAAVS